MSVKAITSVWALHMPPTPKFVLIALADFADDDGRCWPSITTLCERTCFGRTAVIDAIKWLEARGAIQVDRSNGRHTSYRVVPERFNQSASRTGTPPGPVRLADWTRPPPGLDPSASRTGPVRQADSNRQEPSRTVKSNQKKERAIAPALALPDWLPEKAWTDWREHRRQIKHPLTQRAAELTIRTLEDLRKQGHDPVKLIDLAIERGWRGIFAPSARGSPNPSRPSVASGFSDSVYRGTPDDELPEYLRTHTA